MCALHTHNLAGYKCTCVSHISAWEHYNGIQIYSVFRINLFCTSVMQYDIIDLLIIATILVPVHTGQVHDDVIKWKQFPRYWPFVRGNHRWPVNSPHKDQWRGALIFYLIYAWINGWVNNGEAGDSRRHRTHYDLTLMHWNSFETMYT